MSSLGHPPIEDKGGKLCPCPAIMFPFLLPISSKTWSQILRSAYSPLSHCVSDLRPFVLILIRSAKLPFILVSGDEASLSLLFSQVQLFVLGVFCSKELKTQFVING